MARRAAGAALLWLGVAAWAQAPPPNSPGVIGRWVASGDQGVAGLELKSNGEYTRALERPVNNWVRTGTYQLRSGAIEFDSGTPGAKTFLYTLLDADHLRLTLPDGATAVFTRASGNLDAGSVRPGVPNPSSPLEVSRVPSPANAPGTVPGGKPGRANPAGRGLSPADFAMAEAIIRHHTTTYKVPGMQDMVFGPGGFDDFDYLVLLSLKLFQEYKALVPFGEFRKRVEERNGSRVAKLAAERFWAMYREAAPKSGPAAFGGYSNAFSLYITGKSAAKTSDSADKSRQLTGRMSLIQKGAEALQRAVDSDRAFSDSIAQRNLTADQARTEYLNQWHEDANSAEAAYAIWQAGLTTRVQRR